jgi:hypothetical protein
MKLQIALQAGRNSCIKKVQLEPQQQEQYMWVARSWRAAKGHKHLPDEL